MKIRAEREAKSREDEVDTWIKQGRIGGATRARAAAMAHRDMQAARDLFGANPVGTVHRVETGHAISDPRFLYDTEDQPAAGWVR